MDVSRSSPMGWLSFLTGTGPSAQEAVDIASPAFKADPYPYYARLRAAAPVCQVFLPTREHAWLITRYDDVAAALKDERLVKEAVHALAAEQLAAQPWF